MTKRGEPWAIATLEDLEGAIEVLFFPQTFEQVRNLLRRGPDLRGPRAGSTGATTSRRSMRWR